jgi:predicted unusual protein kinase regulating ubiquinone biosynthesis (AarF/ABC1/UbiB family)
LFQAIALHKELIDEKTNDVFLQFTDYVPWSDDEIDYETLINICNEHSLTFNNKSVLPIKSGMISLVFSLEKNNKKVILKMKRKNIDVKLRQGIDDFISFVLFIKWIPFIIEKELFDLIITQVESFIQQLDFEKEVLNTETMFANFKNIPYVVVPYVYKNVTNQYKNAILMSFLEGDSIDNVSEDDYLHYAECVLKFAIVSCFVRGFAHGDLHPGNILFMKDIHVDGGKISHRIGIIDLGITYEFGTHFQKQVFEITDNFFNGGSSREVAEQMIKSGLLFTPIENLPTDEYDDLLTIFTLLLEKRKSEASDIYYNIFDALLKITTYAKTNNKWGNTSLNISPELVKLQMCFTMSCGLTHRLCKNKDYTEFVNECMNKVFHLDIFQS